MKNDYSGNAMQGSVSPRKASSKGSTGGKKSKGKKSGSTTTKSPKNQY